MEYGPILPAKFDAVIQHLRNHFPDEPLNKSVGLCQTGLPCELLEHHNLATLQEGLSVMAVDSETGEIAGVALNGVARPGDVEKELEHMTTIDSEQYRLIFGLLFETNRDCDLFARYSVDRIFELRILSVNGKFRGRGIAKELFQRSELIAEEYGFKMIKVDATSKFSQRCAENLGMKTEKAVRYSDFKDAEGRRRYTLEPPHEFYKVMLKELKSTD